VKERLALGAMLVGSATFLVSLYFDWLNAAFCIPRSVCVPSHNASVDTSGWTGYGQIAAVLAIALAAGAIVAAVKPERASQLPFGRVAIALGIFALLSISALWTSAIALSVLSKSTVIGLGPGAYVGLAGVGVTGAGAALARWRGITRPRSATALAGMFITLALIACFVLPALNADVNSVNGITDLAVFICVFAYLGLLAWHGERSEPRLATAAATATLVAAYLLPLRHRYADWPYELWLLVACTAALVVLGLIGSRSLQFRRPNVSELATSVGSVLLLVSLFLPWQSFTSDGSHFEQRGWSTAALAGVFSLGLLVALVWLGRYARELAIGAALYVLVAGLATATDSIAESPPNGFSFEYGAVLGFVGVALVLVVALSRVRLTPGKSFLVRLVAVLAALALLTFAITPSLLTLSDLLAGTNRFALQSPFVSLALIAAMVVLLTLRAVLRWFDSQGDHAEIVLVPLALLTLSALAVIHDAIVSTNLATVDFAYGKGISWQGWVSVFLCLLLLACGWVERSRVYRPARTDGSAPTTSLATSP
jgi:hypothetical protein